MSDEWEYITDDEGDFVEDENGNILSADQAVEQGLATRDENESTDRGIGTGILIGGAVLGGLHLINKQIKKKRRVKKANPDNVPYKWVKWNGTVPNDAVSSKNSLGKTFIIARGTYEKGMHCGYADPAPKKLYISYGGKEVVLKEFEILTCPQGRLSWIKCNDPKNINTEKAVVGGYEKDDTPIYVCKCMRDQVAYYGKTYKNGYCAYYGFDDKEWKINDFEYLAWN